MQCFDWKAVVQAVMIAGLTAGCASAPDPRPVRRFDDPARAAMNLPYSDAVRVGNLLFLSGKLGTAPGQREVVPGGIAAETKQALENVRATLEANGASLNDVVKCTVILADISEWDAMNVVYRTYFPENKPARTTFGGALVRNAHIEIECIAAVSQPGSL